jgi:hypothetical protein
LAAKERLLIRQADRRQSNSDTLADQLISKPYLAESS